MALFLFQASLMLTFAYLVYVCWSCWNALSHMQRRQLEQEKLSQQEEQK